MPRCAESQTSEQALRRPGAAVFIRGGTPIYAIVRAGGRQLRVEPNQTVDIDRVDGDVGSKIDLSVLMLGGNGNVTVGTPEVDGARVVAEIVEHGRGKKILVFKYKNKTRYRRRQGHRQDYTRIAIKEILSGGKSVEEKPKRSRQSISEPEAEEVKAAVTAVVEVETPKKPARPRKAAVKVETAAEATASEATASVEVKAPKKPATRASKPKAEGKAPAKPKAAKKAPARAKKAASESSDATAEGTE